jgi:hypothetical protein
MASRSIRLPLGLHARSLLVAAALALAGAGCGDGTNTSSQPDLAARGLMVLTVATTPDPPRTGQNTMTIDVKRADGQPVTGAQLTVDPQMPAHGHGSTEVPQITDEGQGRYRAFPVTFQMPGAWRVTIVVKAGADTETKIVDYDVR